MGTLIRDEYYHLLKEWTDALLGCMLSDPAHPSLDGAIMCPACMHIHGRCHEAVYPFLAMADISGEAAYLEAARKLFRWSSCMLNDDGSMYNDSQSDWRGTTVFSAISLFMALEYHGHLLTEEERALWSKQLFQMALWLLDGITTDHFNINYIAAGAAAMALIGRFFGHDAMLARSRQLAEFALGCVTDSGLVYGEGSLKRYATSRSGCAVDAGYNVEETLPSLYEYAREMQDEKAMRIIRKAALKHLDLLLPDGAWDNSFGTRNFKWTYWGSRTADGCQALFNALGKSEPVFAEGAYRNLMMLKRCTHGLLFGGPHYLRHGENPCVHHAFCHAKVLAQALDEGIVEFGRTVIPSDDPQAVVYYPEIETLRLSCGDWRMTVCAGDFPYMKGGHASGGAVTLLWHRACGAVLAAANTDHTLREPLNQQLTRRRKLQGSLCPRLEMQKNGTVYSQIYEFNASVSTTALPDMTQVHLSGRLCDISHQPSPGGETYSLEYKLAKEGLTVRGRITAGTGSEAKFILPVICPSDQLPAVLNGSIVFGSGLRIASPAAIRCDGPVFSLAPGFEAVKLVISPDREGWIGFSVSHEVP